MQYLLEDATRILRRTPRTLSVLLTGLPESWTHATEGPDTWSPYDVVGHLIHGERTDWIARARMMLDNGESRTFDPFDRFAQVEESRGKTLDKLLEEFETLSGANVETLEGWSLTDEELDRTGRHPEFGRVTLRQLLSTWVVHDLGHIAQIARVMAKQYGDQVGPWREYLRVVRD